MIIDDEAIHRIGVRNRLEIAGYELFSAEGWVEALQIIQEQESIQERAPFDLIILDLLMPQPDGFEIFQRLRRLPVLDGIPILLLTAVGLEPQVRNLVEQGAHYLRKQEAPRRIVSEIRRLISESP